MRKNQDGFGVIEIIVVVLLIIIIVAAGIYVFANRSGQLERRLPLYKDTINLDIAAVTDNNFINHYTLQMLLPDVLVGCASSTKIETEAKPSYTGNTLTIELRALVHKPSPEATTRAVCQAVPHAASEEVEVDTDWLKAPGVKILSINGRQHRLTIDYSTYSMKLTSAEAPTGTTTPTLGEADIYFPDKVAVLRDTSCSGKEKETLDNFVRDNHLQLADTKYPGLSHTYLRNNSLNDNNQLNVIYTDALAALKQTIDDEYKKVYAEVEASHPNKSSDYEPLYYCRVTIEKRFTY